jgi:CheY-like chemotaxis protein
VENLKDHGREAEDRKRRFILVLDGNAGERYYTSMILQRFEYKVCTVGTVGEALEFMSLAQPTLLIADATLPGASGLTLLDMMKKDVRLADVPVVIASYTDDASLEKDCRRLGCAGWMVKPLSAEALYRTVQDVIERTPRRNMRIATHLKADLGSGASEVATVISEHGIFVQTPKLLPVNTTVPMKLVIRDRVLRIDALVLYSYGFNEGPFRQPGMGMRFVKISADDSDWIKAFIREQVEEGIAKK